AGIIRNRRYPAPGDHCGWTPRLCSRHCRIEGVWRTRSAMSLSALALFEQRHRAGPSTHQEADCRESAVPIRTRALRPIDGYEAMHLIRKGQIRWLPQGDVVGQRGFIHTLFGV